VSDPADYFAERGFALSFAHPSEEDLEALYVRDGYLSRAEYRRLRKSGAVGPVLATLTRVDNPTAVLEAYGTGADESTAQRAMQRWRTEQGD